MARATRGGRGRARRKCNFRCCFLRKDGGDRRFFSFVISFVHSSLSFVRQINGDKETGEPY